MPDQTRRSRPRSVSTTMAAELTVWPGPGAAYPHRSAGLEQAHHTDRPEPGRSKKRREKAGGDRWKDFGLDQRGEAVPGGRTADSPGAGLISNCSRIEGVAADRVLRPMPVSSSRPVPAS